MTTWPRKKKFVVGQLGHMPKDLRPKTLRLKRGDIRGRTRGDLSAVVWKDKRGVRLLTNIHDPPREVKYCEEHGNAIKPAMWRIITVTQGTLTIDRMTNSYTASRRTWSGKKALFPPVGPDHYQKLHPFIFMRWEENLAQRFSTHPYQRDAGMGGQWATTIYDCWKTSPNIYQHRKT